MSQWVAFALLLGTLVPSLAGCQPTALTRQQQELLHVGEESYSKQQFNQAIESLSQFLAQAPERPEAARAYYIRAMSQAQSGRRGMAYSDLRDCLRIQNSGDTYWRALVVLGTLYYEDSRWSDAVTAFSDALGRMPKAPPRDTVLYRLAVAYERSGQWAYSRSTFQELVDSSPGSSFVDAARRRLELNASAYSIQCGAFADPQKADVQKIELQRKGMNVWVRRDQRARSTLYTVLVGKFATYDDAQRSLGLVKQQVQDAVIWPG